MQSYKSAEMQDRVATLLMCEARLERSGDVVPMDSAVLEETLQQLPNPNRWDPYNTGSDIVVSHGRRRAHLGGKIFRIGGRSKNVMSINPTDDFTVELFGNRRDVVDVRVGFTTRGAFRPTADPIDELVDGMYTLRHYNGTVWGSGKMNEFYGQMHSGQGMLRCVADRANGTIRFYVDGVDYGVAWTGVPREEPLYAVAMFNIIGDIVQLQ